MAKITTTISVEGDLSATRAKQLTRIGLRAIQAELKKDHPRGKVRSKDARTKRTDVKETTVNS